MSRARRKLSPTRACYALGPVHLVLGLLHTGADPFGIERGGLLVKVAPNARALLLRLRKDPVHLGLGVGLDMRDDFFRAFHSLLQSELSRW